MQVIIFLKFIFTHTGIFYMIWWNLLELMWSSVFFTQPLGHRLEDSILLLKFCLMPGKNCELFRSFLIARVRNNGEYQKFTRICCFSFHQILGWRKIFNTLLSFGVCYSSFSRSRRFSKVSIFMWHCFQCVVFSFALISSSIFQHFH